MDLTTIVITHGNRIATVTLARPDVRNAFNQRMIAELTWAFDALSYERDVRAIVLAGLGTAFCAGADLTWMREMADFSPEENLADAGQLAKMLNTIYLCPHPVVARIQGDVYAGGMGLVAACDIAVAADTAQFCLSEVKLGLIPATISPYVIKAMGESAARRYFLTAERFSAAEAHRIGFVHSLTSPETLDATLEGLLSHLISASPHAVREAKRLVRDIGGAPIDEVLIADTAERIAAIRASDEGREGVRAFLDKRKPGWIA
ncbi:MAG: enoyl-CoA hydratase/isomerase family protein [Herminiimonas sp.]|nr:enoyl-CoA hydratase/isomerase family protein [Herminiimonas sp.]